VWSFWMCYLGRHYSTHIPLASIGTHLWMIHGDGSGVSASRVEVTVGVFSWAVTGLAPWEVLSFRITWIVWVLSDWPGSTASSRKGNKLDYAISWEMARVRIDSLQNIYGAKCLGPFYVRHYSYLPHIGGFRHLPHLLDVQSMYDSRWIRYFATTHSRHSRAANTHLLEQLFSLWS
jgi:hypothetical protein